jgi:hypothetical protein
MKFAVVAQETLCFSAIFLTTIHESIGTTMLQVLG